MGFGSKGGPLQMSEFTIYAPCAVIHDATAQTYRLADGATTGAHRRKILTGDDGISRAWDEAGAFLSVGELKTFAIALLGGPDNARFLLERVEVGGLSAGLSTSEPLVPGKTYAILSANDLDGTQSINLAHPGSYMPCLGPGTVVSCRDGDTPVEWLSPGDDVLTRDHGFAAIRWVGRFRLDVSAAHSPENAPVDIAPNTFGNGQPNHLLRVSPAQRVFVTGPEVDLHFASREALAPICGLQVGSAIDMSGDLTLTCLLFDRHELILANSLWVESLYLPADEPQRRAGQPQGIGHAQTVRPCLTSAEAQMISPRVPRRQPLPDRKTSTA
jgi:hypothetical protein